MKSASDLNVPIHGIGLLYQQGYFRQVLAEDGVLVVGNLEELFLRAGAEYPHEVWLATAKDADHEAIVYAVRGFSIEAPQQREDESRQVHRVSPGAGNGAGHRCRQGSGSRTRRG